MNSGSRRGAVRHVVGCVLLVAVLLTGPPAWGEGNGAGGAASGAASSGDGAAASEGRSGNPPDVARADPIIDSAKTLAASPQGATTLEAEPQGAADAETKAGSDPEPPEEPADPGPGPSTDPTPPSDPPPVDPGVIAAPPEAGAESPASPSVPDLPVEMPGMSLAAAEELPAATQVDFFFATGPLGKAFQAQPETATPESINRKLTTPPSTPVTPTAADPASPQLPSAVAPSPSAPADSRGPTANAANPAAGTLLGDALGAAAYPLVAGAALPPAARDIVTQRAGADSSRSASRDVSAVGRLRATGSPGLNQVANVVKDIPAQIKLALAALASLVLLLGAHTVLAAVRTRRLERQRARLMEDIGLLQAALLPAVPSRLGALLTTVAYRPAEGPAAGGDFYDAFALSDGRVGLVLGDISGHGRQALAKTTLVRFTVRAHLEAGMSPREALAISGRSLDGRLSDDFSTVLAAIHDPVKGTLTYASAGHPPPLVIGAQAHEPVTASSAPPIGAGFPTGQRQTVLPMPQGTTVCVYSDGLLEARIAGELLGRQRLGEWLQELGPQATAKALLDLVVQRADSVADDLAACILHAAPGATAPASRIEQLKLDVLDVEGPDLEGFLRACGVSHADCAIAARRVDEQLTISGGVVVEVRIGEHAMVSVASLGDRSAAGSRPASRVR